MNTKKKKKAQQKSIIKDGQAVNVDFPLLAFKQNKINIWGGVGDGVVQQNGSAAILERKLK